MPDLSLATTFNHFCLTYQQCCLLPMAVICLSCHVSGAMAAGLDGCLFALAYLHPPTPLPVASLEFCHVVKCMCLCAEVFFFPVPTLYSSRSIVWGSPFFFSSLSSCYAAILPSTLSSRPVYPLVRWRLCSGRGDLVQEIVCLFCFYVLCSVSL